MAENVDRKTFSNHHEAGNEPLRLWISWELGLSDIFSQVSHSLCLGTTLSPVTNHGSILWEVPRRSTPERTAMRGPT